MDRQVSPYREMVFSRIVSLLANGHLSFHQILRNSYNCDPAFLKNSISALVEKKSIAPVEHEKGDIFYRSVDKDIRSESQICSRTRISKYTFAARLTSVINSQFVNELVQSTQDSIPEATPVYSQWWFSSRSYHNLLSLILRYQSPCASTAFLACPTLGTIFSNITDSPVQILDVDKILLSKLSPLCSSLATLTEYDAATNLPSSLCSRFGFVFVDPPWSRSLLNTFLVRAVSLTSPGGKIAISLPPVLTRPFVHCEREKFFDIAQRLDLRLETVLPSFTEYSVPDFERSAYQQIGLSLDKPWRTGDLFVFTKGTSNSIDIDTQTPLVSKWDQYLYEKRRLFLKRDKLYEKGDPAIGFMPGMDDLKYNSTSSRSELWSEASLVSTRNHIAHAQGRKDLTSILWGIFKNGGHRPETLKERPHLFIELRKTIFSMLGISNEGNNPRGI